MADGLSKLKLKAEISDAALIFADSGDLDEFEEAEEVDDDGECGPNAVLRRRSEFRG